MSVANRNSYDSGASADAQGNLHTVIGQLESLLALRTRQVNTAMADFRAQGVSDEYHGKELRWKAAATEVQKIITLVKSLLTDNDGSAATAQSRAKTAVDNIG
jgi:hypothetical protein